MTTGKRAGSRRGPRQAPRPRARPMLYAAAITLAVIAWGYLVYMAIDFGQSARNGQSSAWTFLAIAAIGGMACLFAGMMLVMRLLREIGILEAPAPRGGESDDPPATPGGRRRA